MGQHKKSGKIEPCDAFVWKEADGRSTSKTRREHERQKIEQHAPYLNKSCGGEGRPAIHRQQNSPTNINNSNEGGGLGSAIAVGIGILGKLLEAFGSVGRK